MAQQVRRVYLDVSALSRPFDDQRQLRILLESDAVLLMLAHMYAGRIKAMWSAAHQLEISANRDNEKRAHLLGLLSQYGEHVALDPAAMWERVNALRAGGLGAVDAVHVAMAESAGADFVTCDDRLLRQFRRVGTVVWFGTPPEYCVKENLR